MAPLRALLANGTLGRQSNSFVLVSEEIKVQKIGNGLPQNKFLSSGSVSKKPVVFFAGKRRIKRITM